MIGIITKGPRTINHAAALKLLGYTVHDKPEHIEVECTGFVSEVDLSKGQDALKALVKAKQLMTYTTKITFADGKVLSSIPATGRLGAASCLMAVDPTAPKKAKGGAGFSIDSLLS